MKAKRASGNDAASTKILEADYVIGKCRSLRATKLKPASFGIHGWLAWISPNRDTGKDVLHLVTSLPNPQKEDGIWHHNLEKISGQKLGFAENGGQPYCYKKASNRPQGARLIDRPPSSQPFCIPESLTSKVVH